MSILVADKLQAVGKDRSGRLTWTPASGPDNVEFLRSRNKKEEGGEKGTAVKSDWLRELFFSFPCAKERLLKPAEERGGGGGDV